VEVKTNNTVLIIQEIYQPTADILDQLLDDLGAWNYTDSIVTLEIRYPDFPSDEIMMSLGFAFAISR